jgi:hypothetical protein
MFNLKFNEMKKIIASILVLIAFKANTQITHEEVLEDGTHVIHIVPRHFSEEELANFRPRLIPTTDQLRKYPLITLSNKMMNSLEKEFKITVEQDSSLENLSDDLFQRYINPSVVSAKSKIITYHQIWILKEPVVNYKRESFIESMVEMIKKQNVQYSLQNLSNFFCKEYELNGTFYLIALIE